MPRIDPTADQGLPLSAQQHDLLDALSRCTCRTVAQLVDHLGTGRTSTPRSLTRLKHHGLACWAKPPGHRGRCWSITDLGRVALTRLEDQGRHPGVPASLAA